MLPSIRDIYQHIRNQTFVWLYILSNIIVNSFWDFLHKPRPLKQYCSKAPSTRRIYLCIYTQQTTHTSMSCNRNCSRSITRIHIFKRGWWRNLARTFNNGPPVYHNNVTFLSHLIIITYSPLSCILKVFWFMVGICRQAVVRGSDAFWYMIP